MAYFLGRDVHASITTEHDVLGISVDAGKAYSNNVLIANVASINAATNTITTTAGHGLTMGDPIMFTMDADSTVGMTNIDAGTTYYTLRQGANTLKVAESRVLADAGTAIDISDSEATTTNITRELVGTSDSSAPNTFIFNRSWPKYDGTGRIDTIVGDSTTAAPLHFSSATDRNRINDLVGLDITMGKVDEDITYFGQRTSLKAEIKNEASVVLTMKKSDHRWETLWMQARDGISSYTSNDFLAHDLDGAASITASTLPNANSVALNHGGTVEGGDVVAVQKQVPSRNFGYRMHIQLKSGATGEILTLQNVCISDYSVSLSPDGVTEESVTLYGFVKPKLDANTNGYASVTTADEL
jgi:hypothetical protein